MMTRVDDNRLEDSQSKDLKSRVEMINESKASLAVSVHQNSYTDESVKGAQVFYYTQSMAGKRAAHIVQNALKKVDSNNTRQEKSNAVYYMLKRTEVPVIIMECGFLSNAEEEQKLITEEYQSQIASAAADGIVEYLESYGG